MDEDELLRPSSVGSGRRASSTEHHGRTIRGRYSSRDEGRNEEESTTESSSEETTTTSASSELTGDSSTTTTTTNSSQDSSNDSSEIMERSDFVPLCINFEETLQVW